MAKSLAVLLVALIGISCVAATTPREQPEAEDGEGSGALLEGSWQVEILAGEVLAANNAIFFELAAGEISGQACNSFSGSYEVGGAAAGEPDRTGLRFGPIGATKMACIGHTSEPAFFGILDQTEAFAVDGSGEHRRLRFFTTAGEALVASATAGAD